MYYILVQGNLRPNKNVNHFIEWFDRYREEQKRWGVISAKAFFGWFGGSHHLTCLYGVESIDRWSAGQEGPRGIEAIIAIDEVVDTLSVRFSVLKEIPVEF